jgi:cytochrome c oxidase assembly protein subunit 15
LFIEHGHRLLGAVVGFVAIALAVSAYLKESRRWVFAFALIVLAAVIFQGGLGGVRVVRMSRTLAMIHGCFGPAFFASCVALAVVTSRFWKQSEQRILQLHQDGGSVGFSKSTVILGFLLIALSYAQLVLGAQLRHVQPTMRPDGFATIVIFHVLTAFLLWLTTAVTWWRLRHGKVDCGDLTPFRPAAWLVGLVGLQITLGVGTWVVNYGWPTFLHSIPGATGFVIQAKGFWDSIVVTAHVATGSLILAVSTMIWVRSLRLRYLTTSKGERNAANDSIALATA